MNLSQKLQIKSGTSWLLFNAPDNYFATLDPLPEGVKISHDPEGNYSGIQLFIKNRDELAATLDVIIPLLKPDTILWVTYPKKNSGIKCDLEMMGNWDELSKYGLRVVTSISVNETWTALRFKPEAETNLSDARNANIRNNEYSNFIDVDNKRIILTPDIAEALHDKPQAMAFYQQLSYSNKKEYVLWILTAKQEKTRNERLVKLVDKLLAGKKNPTEK